jgi:hypothetical protein
MPTLITTGAASAQGFGGRNANISFYSLDTYTGLISNAEVAAMRSTSDNQGNTYYIGTDDIVINTTQYIVPKIIKVNSAGVVEWKKVFSSDFYNNVRGIDIAYAPSGWLYLLFTPTTISSGRLAQIVKINTTANALSGLGASVYLINTSVGTQVGLKLALDAAENIYVSMGGNASYNGMFTVKLNKDLALQWSRVLTWPAGTPTGATGMTGVSLAVDSNGNVYSVGRICKTGGAPYYGMLVLVKYNSSGNLQWQKGFNTDSAYRYIDVSYGRPSPVAVDVLGNIFLGGTYVDYAITNYSYGIMYVIKLNPDGNITWQRYYKTGGYDSPYIKAVNCDPAGNLYILSSHYLDNEANYYSPTFPTITKVTSDGARLWTNYFVRTNSSAQQITTPLLGISVTSSTVNVTGWIYNYGSSTKRAWTTFRLPPDGNRLGNIYTTMSHNVYYFNNLNVTWTSTADMSPVITTGTDAAGGFTVSSLGSTSIYDSTADTVYKTFI